MLSIEQLYAEALRGGEDNSPLATDGYKFAMAQAGFPLRHEEFYLHYRKGGPLFIPFDFAQVVKALRPRLPNTREQGFLTTHGYGMTPAMEAAIQGDLKVWTQPKGTWANENEPLVVPSGPSFLVSWLEPLLIAFNFPMQVATALLDGVRDFTASCNDEAHIIRLVWASLVEQRLTPLRDTLQIKVSDSYLESLKKRLDNLKSTVPDMNQVFDVGMRGMTCMEQHRLVVSACKEAGITRTSNVKLAYELYLIPVGTTGHEHQQRHGRDIEGFRAIRDQRPEPPSYLFDTYDPEWTGSGNDIGIPAAISVMLEDPNRRCSVRFDSGDQERQLQKFVEAQNEHDLNFFYLFMDGYDDTRVWRMCIYAETLGVSVSDCHFGIGGYLVCDPLNPYTRNKVAMVYKLCQSGGSGVGCAVRKYSGTAGKASIAGHPRVAIDEHGQRVIYQEGESPYNPRTLTKAPRPVTFTIQSPGTLALNRTCTLRDFKPSN